MKESELGKTYNDGDIICHEGDEGKSMYVIQSGKVEVIKKRPEGELKLRIMTKGEIFGEIALFDHMPRSATVKAVGEAVVLSIDKKGFFAKASKDPTLVFNILEGMSKRIRDLTHELSKYKKDEELIS
jgi:CRP-like cAMP-binding protein